MSTDATPLPLYDKRPLPAGWLQRIDEKSETPFYVDTLGRPPRSIWVYPLDDPDYLRRTGQLFADEGPGVTHVRDETRFVDAKPPIPTDGSSGGADVASTDPDAGASTSASTQPANPPAPSPKSGLFTKLKGGKQPEALALTPAQREAKRETEAAKYFAEREALLEKRKKEAKEGEMERLLTRPYTAPLPTAWGGPKYAPPVQKPGTKLGRFADGAFNLVFGSSWPEKHGNHRGDW